VKRAGDLPVGYRTTSVFENGAMNAAGVDFIRAAVDRSLWIALMAPTAQLVQKARESLGPSADFGPRALNVGVALAYEMPELGEDAGTRAPIPTVWELSTGRNTGGELDLLTLEQIEDTTREFTRHGV